VDQLIALVLLRLRTEARAVTGSGRRLAALLVLLPALAFLSLAVAVFGYAGVRVLERSRPEALLPLASATAAALGLLWTLSPLLAGIAATETHDLSRLLHFPVPLGILLAASLVANLAQPLVLVQVPPLLALALAFAGPGPRLLPAVAGLFLTLALLLACGQAVGLALHALSRQRRWHDRALFAGLALSVAISLLPLLLVSGAAAPLGRLLAVCLDRDVFGLVPFSWGVRAAIHAGRGDVVGFLSWATAAVLAVAAAGFVSLALARRLYRGELDLGEPRAGGAPRAGLLLPGTLGALVEKDLRIAWRDPRMKAIALTGVLGPLVILLIVGQGLAGEIEPGLLFALACFSGLGAIGTNGLALERHGIVLLLGFPVERLRILVAKNLALLALRSPALLALAAATLLTVGPAFVPAVVSAFVLTHLLACAADNYLQILFPVPVPAAGRDPGAPTAGTRGLGVALLGLGTTLATLAMSLPFAFLAWLPQLLGERRLFWLALPLALLGAAAVYYLLANGAARLLGRREPELVGRVAGGE
jgi:ABC-2 type transport system permease protein